MEVRVPDIGDFTDIPVIEILVQPGDSVQPEDALVTLESDKATMDVPAPAAGVIESIAVKLGDTVSEGDLVLVLTTDAAEAAPPSPDNGNASDTAAEAAPAPAPAATPAAGGGGELVEVRVPDIGDFSDIPVIELLVEPGQQVAAEDGLVTLESDKATMDVPSPVAGEVQALTVKIGDTVSEGDVIAHVQTAGAAASPAPAAPASAPAAPSAAAGTSAPEEPLPVSADPLVPTGRPSPTTKLDEVEPRPEPDTPSHATPGVRRFARELGVDIRQVTGTGRKGRILADDVKAFVKAAVAGASKPAAGGSGAGGFALPAMPEVDFSKWGPIETRPLSRIKRVSGPHLHRSWVNVPHVTNHDEVDITELEAFRKSLKADAEKAGVRMTPLVLIMKALAQALKDHPHFNASLSADAQSLILKQYYNIGIAVDTPNGLVVPVVNDVDKKGLLELSAELGDISARARDGKLKPAEMQGGCMSISSLGGIGGTAFTPIVNAPEVAILGVSRSRMAPVWNGSEFTPRLMLPLDLSYDHRVIDGAEAARFLVHFGGLLSDIRRLLL